jgi:hypothetical protein
VVKNLLGRGIEGHDDCVDRPVELPHALVGDEIEEQKA